MDFRPIALIVALLVALVFGAIYQPAPYPAGYDVQGRDFDGLASLPAAPRWSYRKLPNFARHGVVSEKKEAFFGYLFPRIVLANTRVLALRHHMLDLDNKMGLSDDDKAWLRQQARRLRVDDSQDPEAIIRDLRSRLDVIPPSLIMAQAANESAWGTSRFARQGNNLFGQWCFTQGCGLVPNRRKSGASHEVARFDSPFASIQSYIENLNSHPAYQGLRDVRHAKRRRGYFPDGIGLATGLKSYSERGQAYVDEIQSMIRYNELTEYDKRYQMILDQKTLTLRDILTGGETIAKGSHPAETG